MDETDYTGVMRGMKHVRTASIALAVVSIGAISACSQQQTASAPPSGAEAGNESFLVSGSLSPGMSPGSQADSGPDMRFMGQGPEGGMGPGGGNAPGFGATPGVGFGGGGPGGGGFGGLV